MSDQQQYPYEGWGVLEITGYRKFAGKISVQPLGHISVFEVLIPDEDEDGNEVWRRVTYNVDKLYGLTFCTEAFARAVAKSTKPNPTELLDIPYKVQRAMERIEREEAEKAAAIEAGESPREVTEIDDVPFERRAVFLSDDDYEM